MPRLGHNSLGLLTDLYEITMAAAYFDSGMADQRATFELFFRRLPPHRSFMIAAGLQPALQYLVELRFTADDVRALRRHPMLAGLHREFFERLRAFRFSGNVDAMPEGTPVFPNEPLLRVEGPLLEAQLLETFLLALINYQTTVATKAARITAAAGGRDVIEFGTRRAHTPWAGLYGARAAFIGGCAGTSNVEAWREFGVPASGTFAHSYVLAFPSEDAAFNRFLDIFGERTTLLIDTYDPVGGAERAARLRRRFHAVRLDSGNLLQLSRRIRQLLDAGGHESVLIMATGDLNERRLARLTRARAPIDLYGVGTDLIVSQDAPVLGGVYKLVELTAEHRRRYTAKLSAGKVTYPGAKQVYRVFRSGRAVRDVIACEHERRPAGARSLLASVMRDGRILAAESLETMRERCRRELLALPERCRLLERPSEYPAALSPALMRLLRRAEREQRLR
jgi:nicotinate phosphoribosyltransferase